jgi:hypothetical protein
MVNREEKYKDAGILVQIILTIALIMFVLLYLISNISSFATIVGMLVGLLLLAMAFNNHVSFKRKYFTLIYLIVGTVSFAISLIGYIK